MSPDVARDAPPVTSDATTSVAQVPPRRCAAINSPDEGSVTTTRGSSPRRARYVGGGGIPDPHAERVATGADRHRSPESLGHPHLGTGPGDRVRNDRCACTVHDDRGGSRLGRSSTAPTWNEEPAPVSHPRVRGPATCGSHCGRWRCRSPSPGGVGAASQGSAAGSNGTGHPGGDSLGRATAPRSRTARATGSSAARPPRSSRPRFAGTASRPVGDGMSPSANFAGNPK